MTVSKHTMLMSHAVALTVILLLAVLWKTPTPPTAPMIDSVPQTGKVVMPAPWTQS